MNKRLTKNSPQTISDVLALMTFREMFANYGLKKAGNGYWQNRYNKPFNGKNNPI